MHVIFDSVLFGNNEVGPSLWPRIINPSIPSSLLSYQTQRQFGWLGPVRTRRDEGPPQFATASNRTCDVSNWRLSDASRAILLGC